MDSIRRHILWIALAVQALLLGAHLDLLPLWDDERFTLQTAAQSPGRIIRAVRVDVHPPLYYFLAHGWLKLPLPGGALVRVRALSVILALLGTLLLYLLWLRPLSFEQRLLVLALWVSSPCLVLYARMARSYTLQLVLTLVAVRLARDWLDAPQNKRAMGLYIAAAVALLYTHYLPGLAVVAGTAVLGLSRRPWRQLTALAAIALAYAPWVSTFLHTGVLVVQSRPYRLVPNAAVDNILKLAYAFVAFNFGESLPLWAVAFGAALLPAVLWALWKAWRGTTRPPMLLVLVAAIGYFGAASWVSFAFIGARLLFLLPFYHLFLLRGLDLRRLHGAVTYAGLLLVACGSLSSYYRKQDFFNKGYLVDFAQIARTVRENSRGEPAFLVLDRYTSSAGYYLHGPVFPYRVEILNDPGAPEHALDRIRRTRPALVWYLRSTRNLGPEASGRRLENELSGQYTIQRRYFVPYSRLDRGAMEVLQLADRPTHLVEVLELRSK